eukprot:GFKZ01000704.1.p2 GENE.GFKZ01000704.1~~GFKZ01000704.1.p2  ORF type:complete len:234 (+),score=59.17 GFKZ01000704.1:2105-2806(+)
MAQTHDEDDLDDILDSALDAFDTIDKPPKDIPVKQAPGNVVQLDSAEEGGAEVSAEATRMFEEALKALGDLNVDEVEDSAGIEEDMKLVEEFMKTLGSSVGGGDKPNGTGNAGGAIPEVPEVEKFVESIVGTLLSEDVLKGPMLQMREAYAEWLPAHRERLTEEEAGRYARQQKLVGEICQMYERGGDSGEIMELLSKMQETGAPPEEVMQRVSEKGEGDGQLGKVSEACGMQ